MRKITQYLAWVVFTVGCLFIYKQLFCQGVNLPEAVVQQVIQILSKEFDSPMSIQLMTSLCESDRRNLVLRIKINSAKNDLPTSVIFKQSLQDPEKISVDDKKVFDRFAREWAGLEFVSKLNGEKKLVPQFYGGSVNYRFILQEDLGGNHISILNALRSDDAQAATQALQLYITSLASLHAHGCGKTDEYLAILQRINPSVVTWQAELHAMQEDMAIKLEKILQYLEMPFTQELQKEVIEVLNAVLAPGPFTTFIHGDCCPDNTFYDAHKNTLLFIDFEWGSVRSALLDGTYLRMNMPNCWGGDGALPEKIIESLELLYRQELKGKIPAASNDDDYYSAYVDACAYWMLKAVILIDQPEEVHPRVLSRLQVFVDVAIRYDKLPHLRTMVQQILQDLKVRWPDAKPMALYPAYQNKK